ncbi:hypothetical protein BABINDRAFT_163962 [Babjeviella inositovora NRRL Y-12698]|uniref:NTF2 domain-containing protein n=1 Tax=Babjeviella inositovora NRRL Y-12698 TaxID=984486 RepID=A0A1E3QH01_9ASCO|nr:uncharacterized protein BABINDRAFT_163962 [Babjeviella inositovora NRRL Y-12698]ODQ76961.1 hypothetical protein BABINDRAFT_163962 [Babjeviella inositovora NRRL Y-12698]
MTNEIKGISQEYAETVAFSLLKAYYNLLNNEPSDLFRFYSSNATVTHGSLSQPKRLSEKARGTIGIKDLLSRSELKGCKVMVKHAEIQPCLGDNILVVVLGEMAVGDDSPSVRYVQSFMIAPGMKPGVYDIANDVIRFDPDEEEEAEVEPEVEPTPEVEEEQPKENEDPKEPEAEEPEAKELEAKEPEGKESETKESEAKEPEAKESEAKEPEAKESEATEPEPKEDQKLEPKETLEVKESESKEVSVPKETPVPNGNLLSWASKVASTAKVTAMPTTAVKKIVVAPTKDETEPAKTRTPAVSKLVANQLKLPSNEWFPIYIKGIINPISEDQLKVELQSRFGVVTNVGISGKIALVDFTNAVDQKKALDCGELKVGGNLLKLEVRTKRSNSTYGKKPEVKKELKKEEKPKAGFKPVSPKKKGKKAE